MKVSIVLAFLGLVLVYLEFFLPGAVMGISGGILLALSLLIFYAQTSSTFAFVLFLITILGLLALLITFALKQVRASGKKNTVFLSKDQEGYQASSFDESLIGKKGVARTDLKPSGHVKIDLKDYQAVSKEGYIEKGTHIEVIGGQGSHLFVKPEEEKNS